MARLHIWPNGPIVGRCQVPASKSITNRALLLAGFCHGHSELLGLAQGDDVARARHILQALGIDAHAVDHDPSRLHVQGCGGQPAVPRASLWLGGAGTLARFLPGLLAATTYGLWRLDGGAQLQRRPLRPLLGALRGMGARIDASGVGGGLPLEVAGGGLCGGEVRVAADVSSQFVSGLLMAAAMGHAPTRVIAERGLVQPSYVALTVRCLNAFGARVRAVPGAHAWQVHPARLRGCRFVLEADASTACSFWAAAAATGGEITVVNLDASCDQADMALLDVLRAMGCRVLPAAAGATKSATTGLTVIGPAKLRGSLHVDMRDFSDQAPNVLALGALSDGPVTVTGVGHIRFHESDRLATMARVLGGLGARVEPMHDGLRVTPAPLRGGLVNPSADHRIAMAAAVIALRQPGIIIDDARCVAKTCPNYFSMLAHLGASVSHLQAPMARVQTKSDHDT